MFEDSSSAAATSSSSSVKDSGTKLGEGFLSGITSELPFSSGNPTIEETRGVMHLFRDDLASSVSKLPVSFLFATLRSLFANAACDGFWILASQLVPIQILGFSICKLLFTKFIWSWIWCCILFLLRLVDFSICWLPFTKFLFVKHQSDCNCYMCFLLFFHLCVQLCLRD